VVLAIPNGRWRPDTVITDVEGNEIFVILEQTNEMRSFEVIFGDLEGRKLVCVKRHLMKAFWRDGFYFCTYRPNYPGQKPLTDRDVGNKKVYPFSYLEIQPLKGRFLYRYFDSQERLKPPRMLSQNPWVGFMMVCCTPLMRFGNFTTKFHKPSARLTLIDIDQWNNTVTVGPGNDLLAALCMAYVFDRVQNQPLVTVVGRDEDEELDEMTLDEPADSRKQGNVEVEIPEGSIDSTNTRLIRDGTRAPYRDHVSDENGMMVAYDTPNHDHANNVLYDPYDVRDGHYRDVNLDDEITDNDNTCHQQAPAYPQHEVASKEIV
jgi:hypothetical protein